MPQKNEQHPLLEYLLLILFSIFAAAILVTANAPILGIAFVLFLAPLIVIWQRVDMRTRLLMPISLIAVSATIVIQSYAYRQGLWYEITPSQLMMFGTGPIESYIFATLLIMYLVVMYEYFFDDHASSFGRSFEKAMQIGVLSVLIAIAFGYVFLSAATVVENGFMILIGFLSFALVAMTSVRYQLLQKNIFRKAFLFTTAMLPISLIAEFVLLSNNIRFYAHFNDYVYVFNFLGHPLPLEEIFLLVLLPMWVVILYELCFDDGR